MAEAQKLVLMVQPNRLQGAIWQAVLKSQQITVIWEVADANLPESFGQLKQAGLRLPEVLLLDAQSPGLNPLMFCRWCREYHPDVQVVLTDHTQREIPSYERRWALYQGAADFLPGFQRQNFVSSVAEAVKRILELLDNHPLNNGALISVLLAMKRQLDIRSPQKSPEVIPKATTGQLSHDQFSHRQASHLHLSHSQLNGSANGHTNGTKANQGGAVIMTNSGVIGSTIAAFDLAQERLASASLSTPSDRDLGDCPPAAKLVSPDTPSPQPMSSPDSSPDQAADLEEPPPVRRYRGRVY